MKSAYECIIKLSRFIAREMNKLTVVGSLTNLNFTLILTAEQNISISSSRYLVNPLLTSVADLLHTFKCCKRNEIVITSSLKRRRKLLSVVVYLFNTCKANIHKSEEFPLPFNYITWTEFYEAFILWFFTMNFDKMKNLSMLLIITIHTA